MAAKIIEAKAVISGEDRLSGVIDKINAKLRQVGKGAKVSAEVDRLNRSLGNTRDQLDAIGRIRGAQDKLSTAQLGLSAAQGRADRTATALAVARRGQDAAATADLARQHKAAERSVSQAEAAVERQVVALRGAKLAFAEFGVPVSNLVAHERALKESADRATAALERQARVEREHARLSTERAAAAQRGAAATAAANAANRPSEVLRHRATQGALGEGVSTGAIARFGAAALGVGGVAEGLRRAYGSAMSFERAMIEVGKATDASGADLDAYGERVLKLARDTGKTKEELATMLSSAGFAGRPKQELMDFTEYAAKATVAWRTSADETGQALAEIGNIYEANQKRIEEIGDAINTMADNSASKETDLLEFMRRSGASARQAGISAEKMLAFGAALKEVGVRNEVAATGFEALLNVMKLGAEFSKKAGAGLKALGVDSTKMRKEFVAKPIETTIGLLEKLNKVADPLKKAEIMTDLFGKEYQDDIAKLLNALPKLTQYLALMGDKAKLAAGGVRFQFAANLDKDVSKIDRATQAIDVLMKRLGDPIKVQAGGIAEQINGLVDRLEQGDTIAQRLMKRFAVDGPDKIDLPKVSGDDTLEQWFEKKFPWLSGKNWNNQIDKTIGKTGAEVESLNRKDIADAAAAKEAERQRQVLERPGEIEAQIRRQRGIADQAKGASGLRGGYLRDQAKGAEGEIARLQGDLAKAWDAIGAMRLEQHRDRGAFGIDGPGGKTGAGIGPGRFGFGVGGSTVLPERRVPLPPARPPEFGGSLSPDARIEATVKPDQIRATIDALPPVTGEATLKLEPQKVIVELNTDMFNARVQSAAAAAVAKIPLSSGARRGSLTMPGAATTPGETR